MRHLSLSALIPLLALIMALPSAALAEDATYQPLNIDADGNGGVSMEEYLDVAAKIFIRADTDFDGVITSQDGLDRLLAEARFADAIYTFHRADINKDGVVTEAEIAKDLRRTMERERERTKSLDKMMQEYEDKVAALKEAASSETSEDGDEVDMNDIYGQVSMRVPDEYKDESRHVLSEEALYGLRETIVNALWIDDKSVAIGLIDFQTSMRARFRIADQNGDDIITDNEIYYGRLFSF